MKLVILLLLLLLAACAYHSVGTQESDSDGNESRLVVKPTRQGDQRIAYIWTLADSIRFRPSPFSPPTGRYFLLTETSEVLVEIRDSNDLLIEEVYRGVLQAGYYVVVINRKNMDLGRYILMMHYGGRVEEKEIIR